MSKHLHHRLSYDAPLAEVAAMLRDPEFREQVCDKQLVVSHRIEIEEDGDRAVVTVERVQAVHSIPSFATKIVGDRLDVVQREEWESLESGEYTLTIPGKPGHARGRVELSESAGVTTETVTLDIAVHIPFLGGKLEALVFDLMLHALRAENKVGVAYLAARAGGVADG